MQQQTDYYDLLLTADTIYSLDSLPSLVQLIRKLLRPPTSASSSSKNTSSNNYTTTTTINSSSEAAPTPVSSSPLLPLEFSSLTVSKHDTEQSNQNDLDQAGNGGICLVAAKRYIHPSFLLNPISESPIILSIEYFHIYFSLC